MPKMRLTPAAVDKIKPPPLGQVEYFDQLVPSFGVRVSYKGGKSWFVMTRLDGKLIRMTIGKAQAIPLVKARDEARRLINLAAAGKDPREEKTASKRKREQQRRNTFGVCAEEFLERYALRRLRPSTVRQYQRALKGPDTRPWHSRPAASITRRDVIDLIEKIEARGAPGMAARTLAYLSKFFGWCAERDIIERVPTDRVRSSHQPARRERVLSEDELPFVLRALKEDDTLFGPLFLILLMTGQRRGEVAGMRWSEIRDLETDKAMWEVPAERTKNKLAHLVPLTPQMRDILEALPHTGDLVFSTTGKTPVSGFRKAKERLDARVATWRKEEDLDPMPHWVLHDMRRTVVTMMNEKLGVAPHVVEAVVNHVSGLAKAGVAGVYNRALYLEERQKALARWADFVTSLKMRTR